MDTGLIVTGMKMTTMMIDADVAIPGGQYT